ncbi:hypothetical protein [Candidatus Azobacteroides pseudotrichonymphae]|uniref:hypothetical protein n=1 Tax=Candidatus Azobacteroides pseudotrichonymphae TaxID=511435 RepID=UPI0005A141FE|nr:hypothetical protein [Candidatus Azobacteroides pseudotrichonymphae]
MNMSVSAKAKKLLLTAVLSCGVFFANAEVWQAIKDIASTVFTVECGHLLLKYADSKGRLITLYILG